MSDAKDVTVTVNYQYGQATPKVAVKAEKNSKGYNFEASVSGCDTVSQAIDMLEEAITQLETDYGQKQG